MKTITLNDQQAEFLRLTLEWDREHECISEKSRILLTQILNELYGR